MSPKIVFVLVVESSRKSQIESSSTTGRLSPTIWLELRRRTSYLYAISMQLSRKPQKEDKIEK